MRSRARARPALLVAVLFLVAASPAWAGDPVTGRIDIEARLDPADLKPGQSGMLVIEATLLPKLHIYATGDQAMKYGPIEADGVTYGKPEISKHHVWKDPMDDEFDVWEGTFTVNTKVTLSKDVKPGTKVGMTFTYFGCNDRGCYPPVKDHQAVAVVGGAAAGGVAPGAGGKKNGAPVPPNVAADAGPKIKNVPDSQGGGVRMRVDEEKGLVAVTFTPGFGWHFYPPGSKKGFPISVEPVKAEGVKWGKPRFPEIPDADGTITDPYSVLIKFERDTSATQLEVKVSYGACDDVGTCLTPEQDIILRATWAGGGVAPATDPEPAEQERPKGEVLFPVVDDDDLGAVGKKKNVAGGSLLLLFLIGMGLAFTPCVLPIIPITVSVISGGNADIPKGRLARLLLTYVAGLALTFATLGVVAALAGGSMSAAFESAGVQWAIAILFIVLGFMMLGIYELQPPAWLMNLQGGAQKRSGSFIGAFLFGCLGAIIASPCTGPAIAGLLIATAKSGNVVQGFFEFFALGLGMGAVFFAAGSLNFALRPGPWMVWVRYTFGAILVGAALYYLGSGGLISQQTLYVMGGAIALLGAVGVAWHLQKKEGELPRPARIRGLQVAAMLFAVVPLVGFLTKPPDNLLEWTKVEDRDHLVELVKAANAEGKPAVVDVWAVW